MISIVLICKNERSVEGTVCAILAQVADLEEICEVIVVDSSEGRLDDVRMRLEGVVEWVQFEPFPDRRVSIPHQRNSGVRAAKGEIIVFTDAGCDPDPGWLRNLTEPLLQDEWVAYGLALAAPGSRKLYDSQAVRALASPYLSQCSTINLAFRHEVFDKVNGFDESFAYGSDVDFSWRLVDTGYGIRSVPSAVVRTDWGGPKRQARRSYLYGRARVRLYRKHPSRFRRVMVTDPMVLVYPAFLLGLPLTVLFPLYPALLLIPAWRNRADGPLTVIIDHLIFGVGVLAEFLRI